MVFDINEFVKQRERLQKRFEAEKTGEQLQYIDQSKLYQPIIDSQKKIEDKLLNTQDSQVIVPYLQELQKRNDLLETSQNLPFYNAPIEGWHSTPKKQDVVPVSSIDFDQKLDTSDIENLQDLSLKLPSEVYKIKTYAQVLSKITTEKRRLGQLLRADSKVTDKERVVYQSQKKTLEKYKGLIKNLQYAAEDFEVPRKSGTGLVKPKRKRGRPKTKPEVILHNGPHHLAEMLYDYATAKEAGNTGVDNYIISILDELLRTKAITKDVYDILFKNIF